MRSNQSLNQSYSPLLRERSQVGEEDLNYFQNRAESFGANRVITINPRDDLFFEERVRVSCANNCRNYGMKLSCPPNIPDLDYEKAIKEYSHGLLILLDYEVKDKEDFDKKRLESTNNLHRILLKLESEAFKKSYFLTTSFIGGSCKLCSDCGDVCRHPDLSRIPLEATGVNVISTLDNLGIPLRFPVEKYKKFSRVGLFLPGK